ncbi:zinc finger protein 511 [Prorops nasuta]|uniref:zinc finger protein 511 n=1 Tax=Prorops nasuta TaxID=863751 RepID=UPI0034CEECAF
MEKIDNLLKHYGQGARAIDDPFFNQSFIQKFIVKRIGVTVEGDEELYHNTVKEYDCFVPNCKASFKSTLDFTLHYNTLHRYTCQVCNKPKPTARLLDMHLQECHDEYFKLLSMKQPMYQCYVPGCNVKFYNHNERREHIINIHNYPKNYRFDEPFNSKLKHKNDKLMENENKMDIERNKSKAKNKYIKQKYDDNQRMEADNDKNPKETEKMDMDNEIRMLKTKELPKLFKFNNQKSRMFNAHTKVSEKSVQKEQSSCSTDSPAKPLNSSSPILKTSLMFVPRQVQKSYSKSLTKDQSLVRNVLESGNLMDLVESLP